ncbi:MAG: YihY/virulence factor BrkB family protein [Sphingomonadaceae bacterium]
MRTRVPEALRQLFGKALADGATEAGNIAYLSLLTLFPAAILIVSVAALFGQSQAGQAALSGFFELLPPDIAAVLAPVVEDVAAARATGALSLSLLVAIWTVSGFIETLREILHKAFEVPPGRPFWQTRLLSALGALVAAIAVFLSFSLSLLLQVIRRFLGAVLEPLGLDAHVTSLTALTPNLVAFLALWLLFASLAPRVAGGRHWPGALLVILVWSAAAVLIGPVLAAFGGMARTYGALSGVMVALLFFYVMGFALVLGAELNAMLSKARTLPVEGMTDERAGQRAERSA